MHAPAMNPLRFFRRLHEDEGGAGLAFGALTLLVLVAVVAAGANVWELLRVKVRIQNAADAVAHSAAAVMANTLAVIASLNQTLVWIYRAALAMVASVITTGVLAALNAVFPGLFAWAVPFFHQALAIAVDWLPRLFAWARATARLQDGIVKAAPAAVEAEALRIARANGADAGFVAPVPRLPVERETNLDRFFRRLGGGVVPNWALKHLFPAEASASGRTETYTKGASRVVRGVRRGRPWERTESASAGEESLEQGAQDPRARTLLARYRQIMAEVRARPLPLPLVLTPAYARMQVQAAVWKGSGEARSRVVLGETVFKWPAGAPGLLALAATKPRHPRIDPRRIPVDDDNLYRTDGWEVAWRPVDLKVARQAVRAGPFGKLLDRMEGWIQH